MSDDLVRAQTELDAQARDWGESSELRLLRRVLRVVRSIARGTGVGVRIGNGPPTWIPQDNEQYFDRIGRRHFLGVDSQWLRSEPYT